MTTLLNDHDLSGTRSTLRPESDERSAGIADRLRRLRDQRRVRPLAHLVPGLVSLGLIALAFWSARVGMTWIAIAVAPITAWAIHASLVSMHESVHRMLSRNRFVNEVTGIAIGTLTLTPLSVYRFVHARHHAYLGRPLDPEFRPYGLPGASRARRLSYASAELLCGFVVTPALYSVRTLRAFGEMRTTLRSRLVAEWLLLFACWTAVTITVVRTDTLWPFVWAVLLPGWLTGLLQTLRKFTEHLGRSGATIPELTRTVVTGSRTARLLSLTQFHVDHHGTHHRWPRVPWAVLPEATPWCYGSEVPVFSSHWAALKDALRSLPDPRVGQAITTRRDRCSTPRSVLQLEATRR